jgi:hypothetical protein
VIKVANVEQIIAYESGELSEQAEVELFSDLIKSGECWQLQGHYGRTASYYIQSGIIDDTGKILIDLGYQ